MEPEGSLQRLKSPTTYPYPEPDQSSPYPLSHFLKIHLTLLSFHLRLDLPSGPFPSVFHTKILYIRTSHLPHTCYMSLPSHSSRFGHPTNIWWTVTATDATKINSKWHPARTSAKVLYCFLPGKNASELQRGHIIECQCVSLSWHSSKKVLTSVNIHITSYHS